MQFRLATWNINSVRLRLDLIERLSRAYAPDILCLQEIKCIDDLFPRAAIEALGYPHIAVCGQKGYNGVAILSKIPFSPGDMRDVCGRGHARHLSVKLDGPYGPHPVEVHNLYVPAGGDIPDPAVNDKFKHKLHYLEAMESWFSGLQDRDRRALRGLQPL